VGALRGAADSAALVSGLGWYATKHSLGVYASRPPVHQGAQHFAWQNVQSAVDALPRCRVDPDAGGAVRIETYTVTFDREGAAERGIVACRTADDSRAWANVSDPEALALLCTEEGIGRPGHLARDGNLTLTG
jgi:acetyl-CoA C-acetyltransferase